MHLQYADDTFIFALRVMKILGLGGVNLFLLCSSLPLNAAKTFLIGINLCDEEVASRTSELGCKVDRLPFVYSGSSWWEGRS